MKLAIFDRDKLTKGEVNRLRREGNVPAVFYGSGQSVRHVYVRGSEFQALLRQMQPGLLATTVFELQDGNAVYRALVKGIQYHVVSYAVEHLDFLRLEDNVPVTVNVPIQIVGAADCAGIKLGGTLRQPIRALKVRCTPSRIPSAFQLDVRALGITESRRLSDIEIPANIQPMARMNEVAVVIAKQ